MSIPRQFQNLKPQMWDFHAFLYTQACDCGRRFVVAPTSLFRRHYRYEMLLVGQNKLVPWDLRF